MLFIRTDFFNEIVHEYASALFNVCLEITNDLYVSEEIVQTSCFQVWKRLGKTDAGKKNVVNRLYRSAIDKSYVHVKTLAGNETYLHRKAYMRNVGNWDNRIIATKTLAELKSDISALPTKGQDDATNFFLLATSLHESTDDRFAVVPLNRRRDMLRRRLQAERDRVQVSKAFDGDGHVLRFAAGTMNRVTLDVVDLGNLVSHLDVCNDCLDEYVSRSFTIPSYNHPTLAADISSVLDSRASRSRFRVFRLTVAVGLAIAIFMAQVVPTSTTTITRLTQGVDRIWGTFCSAIDNTGDKFVQYIDNINFREVFGK